MIPLQYRLAAPGYDGRIDGHVSSDLFFAYGTLRRAWSNPAAIALRSNSRFVGKAMMRGRLYQVAEYPGMVDADDGWVTGELYQLFNPVATLAALDEYEGDEYRRIIREAVIDGEPRLAWVYLYLPSIAGVPEILSGDFE